VVVGDRLDTDILMGNKAGAHTVLVLTGITTLQESQAATGDMRPDRVIETLAQLLDDYDECFEPWRSGLELTR